VSAALACIAPSLEFGWNASIVEWLAGLFMAPPSTNTVVSYRSGLGAKFFETLADEPGCAAGVSRMRSAVMTEDSSVFVARKLAVAFTQLFDGVGGSKTVSLYESAHVSESGRLFQAPVGNMEQLLRRSNVSTDATFQEPSDHLSIELALLARLMRHDTGHYAQAELLDDHLLVWLPTFADRCSKTDRTDFYAGASSVVTGFLTAQRAALQINPATKPNTGMTTCQID
jgi:TorA specific chaperone